MRLNLYISKSGIASRRKADCLIKEGKARVNGKVVREPFFRLDSQDEVTVDGQTISLKKHVYLIFNKPEGVTTTLKDRFAESKITDFLPEGFEGAFPVGRLDKRSSGLLIITNDGDLCFNLTHPKFSIEKEYLLELKGLLSEAACRKALAGVADDGDFLKVNNIRILKKDQYDTFCRVVVCEGKKRHLRRLFKSLGFPVRNLQRIRLAGLLLGNLKPGQCRILSKEKISKLLFPKSV
jgi:pseudouridine synthase